MNLIFILATFIISVGILLFIIRLWLNRLEEKTKISDELVEWLKSTNTSTDKKLTEQMNTFNARLDKAAYVIAQVQKNVGEFSEIGRGMKVLQEC